MTPNGKNIIPYTIILISFLATQVYAQKKDFFKNNFRSPVDFTITLSGNFAELRNDHFHSGIDIRTFTTGKKIYAIADGFVSRIKVSATGYGKALYIDHPDGYTSVYAHLDDFNTEINEFVKRLQYEKNSFEFDVHLNKNQLPVKKGNIVAISGNTGSSAGPHLHFEIRDTKSEHPLNPLFFGFKIKDTRAPKIFNLYVYPIDSLSSINGKNSRQKFPVTFYNNRFHLKNDPVLQLAGKVGFALQVNDYMDNTWGKCGIYRLQMKINDSLLTNYAFCEFSFAESRYINSHMDYELNITEKRRIHKSFTDPNNKLSIYSEMKNDGTYQFEADKTYKIDFTAFDANGNTSNLRVRATGVASSNFVQKKYTQFMRYENENTFTREDIELEFPKNSFYTNLKFQHSTTTDSGFLSQIHHVHSKTVPVHKYYTLAIRTNNVPKQFLNKLLIARVNEKKQLVNEGGVFVNGWMKTKTRHLGNFAVTMDTIAPNIQAKTNFKLKSLYGQKLISFKIEDDLSGIQSYQGTIDGKWVLFEYDAKNDHLFYKFDPKRLIAKRKHRLEVHVTDRVGNVNHFVSDFYW